ncbi:MAG: GC-type dockerin domain-anchored protein [Planctomycetota bacterium]
MPGGHTSSFLTIITAVAAFFGVPAAGQYAFNNPQYAIARETPPPAAWLNQPLNEDFTLVIPWFGDSSDDLPDRSRTRMLLTVVDERLLVPTPPYVVGPAATPVSPEPRREIVFELGYVPASGSVVGRALDSGGTLRSVETVSAAPPIEDGEHHCIVAVFDSSGSPEQTGRLSIYLYGSSSSEIKGEYRIDGIVGGLKPLTSNGRIYIGDPFAVDYPEIRASHTGPIFCAFARRGLVYPIRMTEWWDIVEGPQLRLFFGDEPDSEADTIFFYGQAGDDQYVKPGITGRVYGFFDGDPLSWNRWLNPFFIRTVEPDTGGASLQQLQVTPIYEPGFEWSGFYRYTPPSQQLGLDPVKGTLPRLAGVLSGDACGQHAVMGWGLGNSRWSNTSNTPAQIGTADRVSRSHLMGLRDSRTEYDGGLFVFNLNNSGRIQDMSLSNFSDFTAKSDTNWSRFSYGGSQFSLPGTGRALLLKAEAGRTLTPRFLVRRPELPTQSLAVLMMRPNGGTVASSLERVDAQNFPAAPTGAAPLFDQPAIIDTNTARTSEPVLLESADNVNNTIRVPADTVVEIGDAVVLDRNDEVNVITELLHSDGVTSTYQLEHSWPFAQEPTLRDGVWIGPWSYVLLGYQDNLPDPGLPQRGVKLDYVSGGRVTIIGAGYRELEPDRICYILAGRGGKSQAEQAEIEFEGTLRKLAETLGVDLFFAGNATQTPGTLETLEAQLGPLINQAEFVGSPDIVSGTGSSFLELSFSSTHSENRLGATTYPNWAYFQIQDEFPGMFDQTMALWRHDAAHPNGRAMVAAGELWWSRAEELLGTVILPGSCLTGICPGDINRDGRGDASDFFAWVTAYIEQDPICDQNGDSECNSSDFFALISNMQSGCLPL